MQVQSLGWEDPLEEGMQLTPVFMPGGPIQLYIHILFQIVFPYSLVQNIEYIFLCCVVNPCWLSILYTVVCICLFQFPNFSFPHTLSSLVTISLFSMSVHLFLSCT